MSLHGKISIPTRRVLLIEDEALVAMMAADTLSELGYDVVTVGTAHAALEHAHPDCAKFDLPDRLGEDLILDLREICPDLQIIVASGYGEDEVRRRLKADRQFAFLNKPYERTRLRAAIDSLGLAEPSGEQIG